MKPSENMGDKAFLFYRRNVNMCMDKTKSLQLCATPRNKVHPLLGEKTMHSLPQLEEKFKFWCNHLDLLLQPLPPPTIAKKYELDTKTGEIDIVDYSIEKPH